MKYCCIALALAYLLASPLAALAADAPASGTGQHGEAVLIAELALLLLVGRGLVRSCSVWVNPR